MQKLNSFDPNFEFHGQGSCELLNLVAEKVSNMLNNATIQKFLHLRCWWMYAIWAIVYYDLKKTNVTFQ